MNSGFLCPLQGPCFVATRPFLSYSECNEAVARYQALTDPEERHLKAVELYSRCVPLVRGTLRRFCYGQRSRSRCYPGACLPEELQGEAYPLFRVVLDDFDPGRGVDFIGYARRRLLWGLEHSARRLERRLRESAGTIDLDGIAHPAPDDRLLDRIMVQDLLSHLTDGDAELVTRYAEGHTSEELASWAGISNSAMRKRLERVRGRLRVLAEVDA